MQNAEHKLVPTLCVGTQCPAALRRRQAAIDAERRNRAFPRRAWERDARRGGMYIVVLGTSLIVALLGLTALIGQRIENRMLTASASIRQAQLNANSAVELSLLTINQDANWRSAQTNGTWFNVRNTGAGSCSLTVTDPVDANLADDPSEPVVIRGIGNSGQAEQRCEFTIDPRRQPADVLRDSANSGGLIAAQSATIDWSAIITAYQGLGTQINYNSLPTADQFEFAQNVSFNTNLDDWDDDPPGLPDAAFNGPTSFSGHSACLRVDRDDRRAGAGNRLRVGLLKPNTVYQVTIEVHPDLTAVSRPSNWFKVFMITEYANGTYAESPGSMTQLTYLGGNNEWNTLSASITTPAWTEEPASVYLVVNSDRSGGQIHRFYVDNLHVYENVTGRLLYGQALGPTVANPNGVYWIDCGGGKLLVERSRILGTLVVRNPGAGTAIANGPIHLSPATPGYPSLLVQGNFAIRATGRALNEAESGTNFNPSTMPYEFNNPLAAATDTAPSGNNDAYPSEIQGLVGVSGNLTFENQPRLRGQVIVGGAVTGTCSLDFQPHSLINPPPSFFTYRYETRPISVRKAVLP